MQAVVARVRTIISQHIMKHCKMYAIVFYRRRYSLFIVSLLFFCRSCKSAHLLVCCAITFHVARIGLLVTNKSWYAVAIWPARNSLNVIFGHLNVKCEPKMDSNINYFGHYTRASHVYIPIYRSSAPVSSLLQFNKFNGRSNLNNTHTHTCVVYGDHK